ncbi:MAG: CIA30 family protein [Prochlorotrichaceae cyanobacterium]|jgi:hypothetical protein
MTMENRQPWDAKRLLQTLSYFRVIPFIGTLPWIAPAASMTNSFNSNAVSPIFFDFRDPRLDLRETWGAIDDVVMGGVSESQLTLGNGGALFSGVVSTANSGGFASVRTRNFAPPLDLSAFSGIDVRLKGDGQRYKFLLRTTQSWDGLAYSYSFDTPAYEWTTVRIPFADLRPVFRAKTVPDAAPFKASQVISFQLMLSKFEYDGLLNPSFRTGLFQLQLETIAGFR